MLLLSQQFGAKPDAADAFYWTVCACSCYCNRFTYNVQVKAGIQATFSDTAD